MSSSERPRPASSPPPRSERARPRVDERFQPLFGAYRPRGAQMVGRIAGVRNRAERREEGRLQAATQGPSGGTDGLATSRGEILEPPKPRMR